MIPSDPVMLLSFLNLKLRDQYKSLEELCEELSLNATELQNKMASIDYYYEEKSNQFK